MCERYVLGLDFGTQSARAVLAEVETGRELAQAVMEYPHGVMDAALPDGSALPADFALQHPRDYLDCVARIVPQAMREAGVRPEQVVGVGVDFTACTVLPVDASGEPLCFMEGFRGNPHAYVKLWKHHAAQGYASRMTEMAKARGEAFLDRYGGKVSSEWLLPKLWETLAEAPEVYAAADRFVEAADWIVWKLTGQLTRSACCAGYKSFWSKRGGYPSRDFLSALDPGLRTLFEDQMAGDVSPVGEKAGEITRSAAAWTGLEPGTAVAIANVDAHVSLPACGLTKAGQMLMILGTSACHILLAEEERPVPGICGVVEDGVLPDLFGYEAGQTCLGDHFGWFVENCVPEAYFIETRSRGMDIHALLTEKAAAQRPGQSGLVALDWWNGNRSILTDADLSGVLFGMTLRTKPEDIYRALIEGTAYGTRMIVENFERHGVPVRQLYACGGIADKNPMLMQIYADVLKREIRIGRSAQAPALGSAIFGAVAAGEERGGYASIFSAAERMGGTKERKYRPDARNAAVYDALYAEYARMHDLFGSGGDDALKNLRRIKKQANEVSP